MLRRFLSLSMFVVLALAGLGLWYVYSVRVQLDEENRRELAHAARDLSSILASLRSSAEKFIQEAQKESGQKIPPKVQQFARRNPYILPEGAPKTARLTEDASSRQCPRLESPSKLILCPVEGETFDLDIDTQAIFDDVVISDAFEYLFIAENGRVIFGMGHGAAAQHRADMTWLATRAKQDSAREHAVIHLEDLAGLVTADGKPVDLTSLAASSSSRSVLMGANGYELYSYPFEVPGPSAGKDSASREKPRAWVVGGLVTPARMWQEAVTVSPRWTLLLFVFFIFAVAAQPFVKFFVLGSTERLRFVDTCLLLPSAVFLLMLATILFLDSGTYRHMETLAAGGLEALAQRVEDNLTNEFGRMHAQLKDFDDRMGKAYTDGCLQPRVVTDLLSGHVDLPALNFPVRKHLDLDLRQVFWADKDGNQVLTATIYDSAPQTGVGSRPYFKEVQLGHTWSFGPRWETKPEFFVQSVRSLTTAELSTVLAIPSNLRCDDEPLVAAISSQPLWVEWPILPIGYDFAIVNAEGQVQYHSDSRRTLKENLFEEVGDPERLHGAIQGETAQHFTTTYSRRPTELFIRPLNTIKQAGWFLVTLRDREWVETVNTEVLLNALLWSLVPLAVPLLGVLCTLCIGTKSLKYWWPDPQKTGLYRALALIYPAAWLAGLAGVAGFEERLRAWSLIFPLLIAALTLAVYFFCPRKSGHDRIPGAASCTTWYVAALAGLWLSLATVPAAGLFRHSWRQQLEKFDSLEGHRWGQLKADWIARDRAARILQKVKIPKMDDDESLTKRQEILKSYKLPLAKPAGSLAVDLWMDRRLPLYNEAAERLRYEHSPGETGFLTASDLDYRHTGVVFGLPEIVGGALILVVAWWLFRLMARRLFWSRLPAVPAEHEFNSAILLAPSEREKQRLAARYTAAQSVTADGPSVTAATSQILVADFESVVLDAGRRSQELQHLEDAIAKRWTAVIVCCTDPFQFFSGQPVADEDVAHAQTWVPALERARWLRVLDSFALQVCRESGMDAQATEAYFASIWRYCSQSERLALIQVAHEGLANPHQSSTVELLSRKGLLNLDPNLIFADPAFRSFVQGKAAAPEVRKWEHPEGTLGWQGFRWIIGIVLLAALAFVAGTQEAWIKGVAAMLTTLAGGIEALGQILRPFQRHA
jgi:hypothetical protein